MESEGDRKRPAAGEGRVGGEGKRREKMGREERGGGEEAAPSGNLVVEDEVEEFFAILRRMQAASRQLSGVGAAAPSGRIPPVGARQQAPEEEKRSLRRWLPAFEWEDFVEEGDRKIAGVGVSGEMSSATSAPTSARVEEEEQEEEEQRGRSAVSPCSST